MPRASSPATNSGADAADLALYREKFRRRLPKSLDELQGPAQGVVELPLHMAWSGTTSYDMAKPRQRMGLYRTVRAVWEDVFPQLAPARGRPRDGHAGAAHAAPG
ncbi:hypothetical protein [Streptomyces lasiicapitis]|uniref:Uncharacterized protein n=1 Tax=Streptomyces lasiicapitis TaxID=1923961 RepID=A0ABQ2LNA7_9ACTN|nr:hypothetical protein [Streptomyces lasiicapitis]GGO38492.1 hypothetical protein GCM10012286_13590 [Streptomyces lasiicapitis]